MRRRFSRLGLALALCVSFVALALPGSAAATTQSLGVNTTTDPDNTTGACALGGPCSLREAINQANLDTGDSIVFGVGTYTLNSSLGPLFFTKSMAVRGPGASFAAISGNNATQVVDVAGGSVSITAVTLTGGNGTGGSQNQGGAVLVEAGASLTLAGDVVTGNKATLGNGGGIEDEGTLVVKSSTISNNDGGGHQGAGIAVDNPGGPVSATISDSTISGNTNGDGGGLLLNNNGGAFPNAATVTRSAITSNSSTGSGGGVDEAGFAPSSLTLSDSTIASNTAVTNGGGVESASGSTNTLANDTVANNTAGANGGNLNHEGGTTLTVGNSILTGGTASSAANNCGGAPTDGGHNLDSGTSCGFSTANGDQTNANPLLGPLQSNGGPSSTMALLAGSPAINTGSNAGCPATDQRGVARPQQGVCDIGAYEVAPPSLAGASASNVAPTSATLNVTASNPDAVGAAEGFQYGTSTSYGGTVTASLTAFSPATVTSAPITGLRPNTTYHFRALVANPDGSVVGPDQTFTTARVPNTFSFRAVKVSAKGVLSVPIVAPWPGKFTAKATFTARVGKRKVTFVYGTGSVKSGGQGTVTLKIQLRGKAAKELKLLGRARVTISVTFAPTGGSAHTQKHSLTVKRSKKGKYS